MEHVVISILVYNHFGVLTRVTNLFSCRGFNIHSLAVGETENPKFSRITIVTGGDERIINQIRLQLAKLEDVKEIQMIENETLYMREVVLVKVRVAFMQSEEFIQFVERNHAKTTQIQDDIWMVEMCSDTKEVDGFIDKLEIFDIVEISRTGGVALSMSTSTVYDK